MQHNFFQSRFWLILASTCFSLHLWRFRFDLCGEPLKCSPSWKLQPHANFRKRQCDWGFEVLESVPRLCRAPKRQEPLGSLWRLPSPAWVLQPEPHSFSETNQSATSDCLVFTTCRSLTTIQTGYFHWFFSNQKPHIRILTPQIRKWKWTIPDAHCHWHPMISFIWNPCLKGELSQEGVSYSRSYWTQGSVNIYACSLFRNTTYGTKQVSDQTCNTTKCQTCAYFILSSWSCLVYAKEPRQSNTQKTGSS